ncbi:MAG: M16 family metallopeptidase [Deltaproteobacteria bacterium]
MSPRTAFCSGLMALCVAGTARAQRTDFKSAAAANSRPVAKAEVVYSSKQSLGKGVTLARITNGMSVLVQENHSAPVATVRCYVHNTGSAYEGKYLGAGLSHMLEHLVAGGSTTRRTYDQIREILDSLGGHTNAYTSDSVTCFLIDCPASGVSVAVELIADNMQNSTIPENEYQREWGVVQRELEMGEADRKHVLYNAMKQLIYTEHPVRHPTVGYLAVVQQVKRDDVIAFYKNRYVPQNMTFVVVGDVNTDDVLDTVLAMFKNFQRTTERFEAMEAEPEQASPRSARLEMEGPTTDFAAAWPTVALQDPDLYPLDVASFILSHGESSRLVRRLQIEQPLALSVASASNTPGFVKGWFEVEAKCAPKNIEAVRKIVFEEIERLKTEPVSADELAKAKRQKAAEHVFQQQTVENQAEMLSESYRSTGDPLFDASYVEGIQKVTADQILEVARKYFLAQHLNTVTIDPLGSGKARAAASAEKDAETPILKKQLASGLTVLLKRQSTLPLVTIQAYVKGGVVADTAETAGLASLTTEMLEKGTKKFSAGQIAEYFDSIGGALGLSSATNTCFLQTAVLKEDAVQSLDYVAQVLFEPTFPEDEFANVREIRLGRIAARKAEPRAEIMDFWAKQLPPASPYSRTSLGLAATVEKLSPADCRKFHKKYFVPNNMVLSVFGDIDPQAMLKRIEEMFGKVPKAEGFKWPDFPAAQTPLSSDLVRHLQNQKQNTAMVLIAYPAVSVAEEKTRAALDVLDALLTGGGAAGGRLHEELRGEQLVYYVFGMQMTGFAPGYFVFLAQTRPESVAQVVGRIRAGVDRIRLEGIPADEFEKAKEKLIVSHAMKNTTPAERAFQASIDELYGLGYDYDKSYPDRIGKVKIDDVVAVVKKYFEHAVVVTSSTEPAAEGKPAGNAKKK